jgi:hypothetical protein
LHDLCWDDEKNGLVSKDKRFEADFANVVREFLVGEGEEGDWDKHRLQLA